MSKTWGARDCGGAVDDGVGVGASGAAGGAGGAGDRGGEVTKGRSRYDQKRQSDTGQIVQGVNEKIRPQTYNFTVSVVRVL